MTDPVTQEETDVLKVAHFVQVAKNASGLYETTREVAWAQTKYLGWDARMVDVTGIVTGNGQPVREGEDREVPIVPLEWSRRADVHFLHTGIPREVEGTRLVVYFAHGLPEYCFYSQLMTEVSPNEEIRRQRAQRTPFGGSWSLITSFGKKKWMRAAVTLWKRHVPFWEPYFSKVILANHFCDLESFTPEGEKTEYLSPAGPKGLNITFADHWRYTAFKDPFQLLHGVRKFAMETGSRVHLYAIPKDEVTDLRHPWNSVVHGVSEELKHTVGDLWTVHPEIDKVHRTADLLITPSCDDTRTVLEAAACGCPVLAREGAEGASFHCRFEDPNEVDKTLWQVYKRLRKDRETCRRQARQLAENFSLEAAVKKIEDGLVNAL